MPKHMRVQQTAMQRNNYVEILVDYILLIALEKLQEDNVIESFEEPLRHKQFVRGDTSDVFDHFFTINTFEPIDGKSTFNIWGQTTCYKGNRLGKPESNKTYEIRETLIESLSLRQWLLAENEAFRTFHITMGPSNYTYGWFEAAKKNAFDLSIYPSIELNTEELFKELFILFSETAVEFEFHQKLEIIMDESSKSVVKDFIFYFREIFYKWISNDIKKSDIADMQANLIYQIRLQKEQELKLALSQSKSGGMDIKGKVIEGKETTDWALNNVMDTVSLRNPFLKDSRNVLKDWDTESEKLFSVPSSCLNLEDYVEFLWTNEAKLINRRLLFRIHTEESINYIQDLDIEGISEHNLYNGDHSQVIITEIVGLLVAKYNEENIFTGNDLYGKLISPRAKKILSASWYFEINNGTSIKPSFYYVEEVLSNSFDLVNFSQTDLERPISYNVNLSNDVVRAYQNLKVIIQKETKQPIAIIKAKFFSEKEFARRCKEEAYVGLTTTFNYKEDKFVKRYDDLPMIMFIDMVEDFIPPEYAVSKLVNSGWTVFFNIEDLLEFLSFRVLKNE